MVFWWRWNIYRSFRCHGAPGFSSNAVAEFNGDGKLDMAVVSNAVTVFPGQRNGIFAAGKTLPADDIQK